VLYTASGVDDGIDAWKRQLHEANLAYRDDEFSAQVSSDVPNLDEHLQELGFTKMGTGKDVVLVKGSKSKLRLEGFAASNQGPSSQKEVEVAKILMSLVQTIAGQPELFKAIGAKNLLKLLAEATRIGGGPSDIDEQLQLQPKKDGDEEVPENVVEAINKAIQALTQTLEQKTLQPIGQEMAQDKQRLDSLESAVKQLEGIYQVAQAEQEKAKALQTKVISDARRKDTVMAQDQRRKNTALQAELQRRAVETEGKLAIERERATGKMQVETAKAMHGTGLDTAKAAHAAALERASASPPESEPPASTE